jgi:hypothetical protein
VDECKPLMRAWITNEKVIPDRDYLICAKDVDNIRTQVDSTAWKYDINDAKSVVGLV